MSVPSLNSEQYEIIAEMAKGQALSGVWAYFEAAGVLADGQESPLARWGLDTCREIFLDVLSRLIRDGRIRLAKNGKFLVGCPEDQVRAFRERFPKSLNDVSEIGGVGTWFFLPECPAGAVWVVKTEDGGEILEWT